MLGGAPRLRNEDSEQHRQSPLALCFRASPLSPREVEPMIHEAEPAPAVTKTKSVLEMTPAERNARKLEL